MRRRLERGRLPGGARRRNWSTARCGKPPATGRNSASTCSSPSVEDEDKILALKPMNCPCHVQIFTPGPAQLSRAAAAHGRVRRLPPLRAVGRAARHHAGARLHPGRRAHLLHRGPDRRRDRRGSAICCAGLSRFRLHRRSAIKFSDRPAVRAGTDEVWDQAEAALQGRLRRGRRRLHAQPGRGRVLRPEARIRAARRDRPRLAVRHLAGRFRPARAAGRRICRRGRRAAPAGDAAPRHPRLVRALPRHPDRALCRPLSALAGAGAGGGRDHRLRRRRLCRGGGGGAAGGRAVRARPISAQREDQLQDARAQPGNRCR